MKPDWPTDSATGEVFDLDWLDVGTRRPVSGVEQRIINRASVAADPGAVLYAEGVAAYVRSEYHRQYAVRRFGTNFLHQPAAVLALGEVRGVFYLEWSDHIDHLKRTGHLEDALALTYECIDAAARANTLGGWANGPGWVERAAVILRKMKDFDAEVRLLEQHLAENGSAERVESRLQVARRLASQQ